MSRTTAAASFTLLTLLVSGCSARSFVAAKVGDALSSDGASWSTEDDPQLVRDALPFALKTMESLAAEAPRHAGLRLALCRGYSSYAAGFLEPDAERIEAVEFEAAKAIRERASRLYLRALGYCRAALDLEYRGAGKELATDPDAALARIPKAGVDLLYWTGVAWGSAISLGLDRPDRVADLPTVRAVFERALALDETYDRGSLHEAMIVFDSMPAMMGGSAEGAQRHFDRAVLLSQGERASPYVTWARSSAVARQARREYRESLEKALAVDPDRSPPDRLLNLVSQGRARVLLARTEDFFFVDESEAGSAPGTADAPAKTNEDSGNAEHQE
ncbi:MAG: TRAP transporter TatT component family protein [Thermoanaerobaculia bacterium]